MTLSFGAHFVRLGHPGRWSCILHCISVALGTRQEAHSGLSASSRIARFVFISQGSENPARKETSNLCSGPPRPQKSWRVERETWAKKGVYVH